MLNKDEVIVLGIVPYKEQNLILKTYSKGHGIITFFVPKSKSTKAAKNNFTTFSLLDLIYEDNKKDSLPKLLESKIKYPLLDIRFTIQKSTIALLLAEILGKCIREEEANSELYQFLEEQILCLENSKEKYANFYLHFLCKLMYHLGFGPAITSGKFFDVVEGTFLPTTPSHFHFFSEQDSLFLKQFLLSTWEESQAIQLNGAKRIDLLQQILNYYKLHLGGFENPKSLAIITDIFQA